MEHQPPQPAPTVEPAQWIEARLSSQFGAVGKTIPTGFPAYARILHPVNPGGDTPMRWSAVAEHNGHTMHALAQYERISTPSRPDIAPLDNVSPPMIGELEAEPLRALCEILARHTAVADRCWFAVWEGWGWASGVTFSRRGRNPAPPPAPAPAEWQLDLTGPTFALPDRTYHLFVGPVEAALRIGHWATRDWFIPHSPNLFWPDDRAWCVAGEIDFDSTLVGGPARLIDDVLNHEALEAWPVELGDSLAFDGDTVNRR